MKKDLQDLIEKSRKRESRKILESQIKSLIKEVEARDRVILLAVSAN